MARQSLNKRKRNSNEDSLRISLFFYRYFKKKGISHATALEAKKELIKKIATDDEYHGLHVARSRNLTEYNKFSKDFVEPKLTSYSSHEKAKKLKQLPDKGRNLTSAEAGLTGVAAILRDARLKNEKLPDKGRSLTSTEAGLVGAAAIRRDLRLKNEKLPDKGRNLTSVEAGLVGTAAFARDARLRNEKLPDKGRNLTSVEAGLFGAVGVARDARLRNEKLPDKGRGLTSAEAGLIGVAALARDARLENEKLMDHGWILSPTQPEPTKRTTIGGKPKLGHQKKGFFINPEEHMDVGAKLPTRSYRTPNW